MFYRASGIRHTTYLTDRSLWPLPFDRYLVGLVVVVLLAAPWVVNSLYLGTYMLPWLVWASATLGLNLLIGGAGQVHLGYGAVMAIGAYSAVHLARMGLPFELVLIAAGLLSAVIGVLFGAAALRVHRGRVAGAVGGNAVGEDGATRGYRACGGVSGVGEGLFHDRTDGACEWWVVHGVLMCCPGAPRFGAPPSPRCRWAGWAASVRTYLLRNARSRLSSAEICPASADYAGSTTETAGVKKYPP